MKPTSNRNQNFAFVLTILFLLFIFTLCVLSYKYPVTPGFVLYIVGNITGGMGVCIAFLFGSTKGSQDKDAAQKDTTDNLVAQLAISAPASAATPGTTTNSVTVATTEVPPKKEDQP